MSDEVTFYRRPLPPPAIAFSSPEGRALFREALAAGELEGFFLLVEQFHTQSEPDDRGLGALVVALNALGIDPQRRWKGSWRWFSEELLASSAQASADDARQGCSLDHFVDIARSSNVRVEVLRGGGSDPESLRGVLRETAATSSGRVAIAAYERGVLGQTGTGHYSPLGGYHPPRDLVLILDVERFKYPPHWVSVPLLWAAMRTIDPETGQARGLCVLSRPR